MVDITKDEMWENKDEEVVTKERKESKLRSLISKYKWITILIGSFLVLTISNGFLIYNFLKIFINM